MILALCGEIGVGKTHIVRRELVPRGFIDIAFADHLKIQAIAEGVLTYEEAYVTKPAKMREWMVQRGTIEGWKKIRADMWVDAALAWIRRIRESLPAAKFVISDARFLGELEALTRHGIPIVKIVAPQRNKQAVQGVYAEAVLQENPLKEYTGPISAIIHNDYGVNDLTAQVDRILATLQGASHGQKEEPSAVVNDEESPSGN